MRIFTPRSLWIGLAFVLANWVGPVAAQDDDWATDWSSEGDDQGFDLEMFGFVETMTSARVVEDDTQSDELLVGEARFQLQLDHQSSWETMALRADLVADAISSNLAIELREASIYLAPTDWFDIKVGRQALTWGTGDLLFLNDHFPKDWVSFFAGRANEYLKAPSTAIRAGLYANRFGIELIWTPIFEPDVTITGERLSYFDPGSGEIQGEERIVDPVDPSVRLRNGEGALRLTQGVGSLELAAYGYIGFTKQPLAFDLDAGRPTFSRLASYGLSARNPLLGGVFNLEGAFHHSLDDSQGTDPLVPNSQVRGLLGFERELVANWTLGAQYYVEYHLQHDDHIAALPSAAFERDELTHRISLRLTARLMRDDLTASLFALGSPNEMDLYIRTSLAYRFSDATSLEVGGNLMFGEEEHTFIGQLQHNTNAFARLRYGF